MAQPSGSSEIAGQAGQWLQGMRDAAMSMANREKKDEDEAYSPFANLQKAAVLQETRCFNDREINPRKCIGILTRILWLLTQGDKLSRLETTEVFFGVTKLLQAKDQHMVRSVECTTLPENASRLRRPAMPFAWWRPVPPASARSALRCAGINDVRWSAPTAAPAALSDAEGAQAEPRGGDHRLRNAH